MIEVPQRKAGCPAPVQLELLAAGDEVEPAVKAHAQGCADCQPYVQSLEAAAGDYRRARPSEQMLQKLSRRAAESASRRGFLVGWRSLALAGWTSLAAVTVLYFGVGHPAEVRLKGGAEPALAVFVQRGAQPQAGATQLLDGARVQAGDALRFQYTAPGDGYLLVVDVDGTGRVTVFHPFGSTLAHAVSPGAAELLPDAVRLDASAGPERIAAVFRPTPFTLADVQSWLGNIPVQRLPELRCADCRVQWITLQKR